VLGQGQVAPATAGGVYDRDPISTGCVIASPRRLRFDGAWAPSRFAKFRVRSMKISASPTLNVLGAAALIYALYLPIALWLQYSYVPPTHRSRPPRLAAPAWPLGPISPYGQGGIAFQAHVDVFAALEEDNEAEQHSPVVLYEDGKPLGRAHSMVVDIARGGGGRYTHLKGVGIVFSSSDNTDPTKNGRHYSTMCRTEAPVANVPQCGP
jgi:hypothetical protein